MILTTTTSFTAKDGVVIATDKKMRTPLIDETSTQKTELVTDNIGMVYSGMGADYRLLVRKARKKAAVYERTYHESIPVVILVREVAAIMQEYTQSGGVRPFGVSLLIAGFDINGPHLYQVDPSGAYFGWKASAIGSKSTECKTFLEKRFNDDMELEDAIHTALLTLKEGFDGEMTSENIEVGIIDKSCKFRTLTAAEIKDYLEETE